MLIDDYDLEVFTPPCDPGAERYAALGRLTADISEALPYLNAALQGAIYHQTANTLTWKKGGHNIAFHAYEIATSNVADRGVAIRELDGLVALVNRIWERREEITPDYESHQRPTPMAIYRLLPQTNCRECGEPSCFALALKLAASQKAITDCSSIFTSPNAERLQALQAIVIEAPAFN